MINTSLVIENTKTDIQNKIDMEQKRLKDIVLAVQECENFLLENEYSEIKEGEDVLQEVIKTIYSLKDKNKLNQKDIDNIQKSIDSLKNIKNSIDENIITSLNKKISEIQTDIDKTEEKLDKISNYLLILLNLELVCPACNGNCHVSIPNEDKRFKNTSGISSQTCSYCDGVGVLNIAKILLNEKIMDKEIYKILMNTNNKKNNLESNFQTAIRIPSDNNKYTINRK